MSSCRPGGHSADSAVTGAGVHTSIPHPFPPAPSSVSVRWRGVSRAETRTDDNVHVPARKARVDEDATYLLLLAPGQLDVHVVGPLELHALRTAIVVVVVPAAQDLSVAARVEDGQADQILHKDEARRWESAEWGADVDGELEASLGRKPGVGSATTTCELERREGDDRRRKRCQKSRVPR